MPYMLSFLTDFTMWRERNIKKSRNVKNVLDHKAQQCINTSNRIRLYEPRVTETEKKIFF